MHEDRPKMSGFCQVKYKDGTIYEGNMVKGKRHGRGVLKTAESYYQGNFYNDNA